MQLVKELALGFFWDTVGLSIAQFFWKCFAIITMIFNPPREFEIFHRCAVDAALLIMLSASLCRWYRYVSRNQ